MRLGRLYGAIVLAFSGSIAVPAHAICTSPASVAAPWTNANGNIPSCTNIDGGATLGSNAVVQLQGQSTNFTVSAAGDNVYDDHGNGTNESTIWVYNSNPTTLEFQLNGNQLIQETGAYKTNWQGILLQANAAQSISELTIAPQANVVLNGPAQNAYQVGISLLTQSSGGLAELQLDGSLSVEFTTSSATVNQDNVALYVQAGSQVVGDGALNVGVAGTQVSQGIGISTQASTLVTLTGPVSIYTSTVSVLANGGTVTLDGSGLGAGNFDQFVSQGAGTNPNVFAVLQDASLTLRQAVVTLQNAGPNAVSQAFDLDTTGNVVLDNVQITSDNSTTTSAPPHYGSGGNYAAAIDSTAGSLKASGVQIVTNQSNVYGLLIDDYPGTGSILFCGTNGGTSPTACDPSSGTPEQNSITTNGAGADGIFLDNASRTLELTSTTVTANGAGAAALMLGMGTFISYAGNVFNANGPNGVGVWYGYSGSPLSATFDPSTQISAAGAGTMGFVADGAVSLSLENCTTTSCAPISSATPTTAGGLPFANFSVTGSGAAAVVAQDGATVDLVGVNLATASIGAGAWGVKAGGQGTGTVQFTNGAQSGGVGLWAADGGTLNFNDDTSGASGSLVEIDAGTTGGLLDLSGRTSALTAGLLESGGTGASPGTVNLGSNDLVLVGAATNSATFSGSIEGAGGLTMNGTGNTQILSGETVFDYTGATNIQNGTLAVANGAVGRDVNGNWKTFGVDTGGTLDISANGGSFQLGGISGSGAVQTGGAGLSSDLVLEGSGSQVFSGTIAGAGGLTMLGSGGTQTLSGNSVFDYTGNTTIAAGTLAVGGATGTNVANDTFTFDSTFGTGGVLDVSNGGFTLGGLVATNSGTTAQVNLGGLSGPAANLTFAAASGTFTYSGTISGNGELVKEGMSTQVLSGLNAFGNTNGGVAGTGTAVLDSGVLEIQNVDPSQLTYNFVMNGGWLDLSSVPAATVNQWTGLQLTNGQNAALGGVIGANDKIQIGQSGADQTDAFQIGGGTGTGLEGPGVYVVKTGSNTVTLTGDNQYVGTTEIQQGTLKVSSDGNLGDTSYDRDVILNGPGATLEIAGTFDSNRQLQLLQGGTVQVDSGYSTAWSNVAGAGETLTKTGDGALAFTAASTLGQAIVQGGSLNLGPALVDATGSAGSAAITQGANTTVTLSQGTVISSADGIVANGTSVLNLSDDTVVTVGTGNSIYHVLSGTGTLNAIEETLVGGLQADSGASLAINLMQGSQYTGVPNLASGATASLSIDSTSAWNLTGDATLTSLVNNGQIVFGAQATGVANANAIANAAGVTNYQTLTVSGNYQGDQVVQGEGGGASVAMRTDLNVGGPISNQLTDRLLITGNASGQTSLSLTTSGTGANTNTAGNNQFVPTEGISLVQVGGQSAANAFTLAGGFVVAPDSPFQYRLFAYGPGSSYGAAAASQDLLPNGQALTWDYRLQTSYTDPSGQTQPGTPPGGGGHETLVPQGSSYLTAPLALQNYEDTIVDDLYRRLGDIRQSFLDPSVQTEEVFARTIDSRSIYHSNLGFSQYGYNFNQDIEALQFGGNWLRRTSESEDLRLGVAATLGNTSINPGATATESSTASIATYNLALTGTWQRRDGWYVDGVVSAGHYSGPVNTAQQGEVVRFIANGFDASLEGGKSFVFDSGLEIEPHAQILSQLLSVESGLDTDGVSVSTSTLFSVTGRLGVLLSMPLPSSVSWKPYVRLDFQYSSTNSPTVTMSGQPFEIGAQGGAVQLGIGATGMITPTLSAYGELSGRQHIGYGFDNIEGTLGLRYVF